MRLSLVSRSGAAAAAWLVTCVAVAGLTVAAAGRLQEAHGPKTVWNGTYSEAQAVRGQEAYRRDCAGCHLDTLSGADMAPALVGETFLKEWDGLSVGDLFERIRLSMPQDAVASLPRQTYADIVAYILKANAFPSGPSDLDHDLTTLKAIKFVKRSEQR
jgi:mono/diheme cytochrome c family protein